MEPEKRDRLRFGGHSMVGPLRRVLVCDPEAAGWGRERHADRWRDLGYFHRPDLGVAKAQHRKMVEELEKAGAEVVFLPEADDLSLDAVYSHDASFMTDFGAVCMRMGKAARGTEPGSHARFYESQEIPILGAVEAPGTAEGGDIVWLDGTTLLVGRGYRTNDSGIEQMHSLLSPKGIDVVAAPLPHGPGPETCLHLMSLMSVLDDSTVLVDLAWLAVPTVELLGRRGFRWIEIDSSERETMACNVLALGRKRLLALEENTKTNARLRESGFEVLTFAGSEISQNGGGGPTCLTRPIRRG